MANFQFGQDNVGSGWQVPSWYVQGMSQSPMAASIAGIGNSIAAFSGGYQSARQAERGYGLDERRVKAQEDQIKQQGSYYDSLNKQRQEAGNEDRVIGNWLSGLGYDASRYIEWVNAGRPSASGGSVATPTRSPAIFQDPNLTPAQSPFYGLPTMQGGFPVNPEALTGYQ